MGSLSPEELRDFEPLGQPRLATGVYLLLLKGEVLYIGKSLNVYQRMGYHVQVMRRMKKGARPYKGKEELPFIEFDEVRVKWVPKAFLDAEELKLIQRHMPEYNTLLNRPNIDVSKVPGVAKMLAKAPLSRTAFNRHVFHHVKRRAA